MDIAGISDFLVSFVTLFVIMDPLASLPIYLNVTRKLKVEGKRSAAMTATFVAYAVLVAFIFFGTSILSLFGITLAGFRIAGGILLFLIAVRTLLMEDGVKSGPTDAALMLIAVPLITGSGAITSAILLTSTYGALTVFLAATLASALIFLLLYAAPLIERVVSRRSMQLFTKVMMLLLASIAIEFIKNGVLEILSKAA